MPSERHIQHAIMAALGSIEGCVFWRNPVGFDPINRVKYGLCVGSSDLIGLVNGKFVAVEVKTAKGRTSEAQDLFAGCVEMNGGHAFVVRSEEEAVRAVEGVMKL